ncbi:MAG: isoprenoid biosynthesis glyoxalase ElbB [Candidatus Cloacimonadota bacterium]|nr:isoprenoid biosynthesis glyoxalase ElbB [Candidatus Cloacimonadota bacterium]
MKNYENKTVGVILSGSGWQDGSEIQEAVLTLLHLDNEGANIKIIAPNKSQMDVVEHVNNTTTKGESRNVLVESARIARGNISDISEISANELDALIIPGGFGVAKNLCDFAVKGADMSVMKSTEDLILEMHKANKSLGFICIAPVLAAKVLGKFKPKLTIGNDLGTAKIIEKLGANHINCPVDEIVYDEVNNVVTTPAYMLGPSISWVSKGIEKLVVKVLELS